MLLKSKGYTAAAVLDLADLQHLVMVMEKHSQQRKQVPARGAELYGFWERQFARAGDILGRTIKLDGLDYTSG